MDLFTIADKTFTSRLIVGTGKYSSPAVMVQAHEASGADMITVAVRRVNISDRTKESLLDYIDTSKYFLLPNTAGCYTADEAVRTARLGREAGLSNWVKLEVIGDERTLFPDNEQLHRGDAHPRPRRVRRAALHDRRSGRLPQARRRRRGRGHAARRADRIGARHPERRTTCASSASSRACRSSSTPASARRRTRRWRWSSAPTRVLMNTAIAGAQDAVAMAEAMKLAVRAGRLAYLAGTHSAQDVRERQQPDRRPGRPVDVPSSPDDLAGLKAERAAADREYNDALTRLDRAIQQLPADFPAPAARHRTNTRSRRSTRSGRSTCRRRAAAGAAASSPPSGAPSRRCSSSSRRSTRRSSITSTATCRCARETRESIDSTLTVLRDTIARAGPVPEPAGRVPAADHAVRRHARSRRRRPAARPVRRDQRRRRRGDEAVGGGARRAIGATTSAWRTSRRGSPSCAAAGGADSRRSWRADRAWLARAERPAVVWRSLAAAPGPPGDPRLVHASPCSSSESRVHQADRRLRARHEPRLTGRRSAHGGGAGAAREPCCLNSPATSSSGSSEAVVLAFFTGWLLRALTDRPGSGRPVDDRLAARGCGCGVGRRRRLAAPTVSGRARGDRPAAVLRVLPAHRIASGSSTAPAWSRAWRWPPRRSRCFASGRSWPSRCRWRSPCQPPSRRHRACCSGTASRRRRSSPATRASAIASARMSPM